MKLIDAKCPNCKAVLKLDGDKEKVVCEYCHHTIVVEDAIATYKLKVSGSVSVEGIETNNDLIDAANELLDMGEYLKAKKKFLEFSEKCPEKYQGWLGLLICRTRNFTIRDNNILFENDINKYYEHFLRTASESVKKDYLEPIENYMFPDRAKEKENNEETNSSNKSTSNASSNTKSNNDVLNYIVSGISLLLFLACLTDNKILPIIMWLIAFLIFLPPLNKFICNKFPSIKINMKGIKIIVIIIAFLVWIFSINSFDGTWIDGNGTFVKLSSEHCYIGSYKEEENSITYETEDEYEYKYTYDEGTYLIECGPNYMFKYMNDTLCFIKDEECSKYFEKVKSEEADSKDSTEEK